MNLRSLGPKGPVGLPAQTQDGEGAGLAALWSREAVKTGVGDQRTC